MHLLSTTHGPFTSKPIMHTSFIEYPLKICACHARFNWQTLRYVQQAKRSEEIRSRRGGDIISGTWAASVDRAFSAMELP